MVQTGRKIKQRGNSFGPRPAVHGIGFWNIIFILWMQVQRFLMLFVVWQISCYTEKNRLYGDVTFDGEKYDGSISQNQMMRPPVKR